MICPNCGAGLHCIDSREQDNVRYRRYKCKICGNRMSTVEVAGDEAYVRLHANRIINAMKDGTYYR